MDLLFLACAYLIIHLAVISFLQRRVIRRGERTILLLHVGSFAIAATALCVARALPNTAMTISGVAGALTLHAIYSLSYLELWALSDGSLSLRILADVASSPQRSRSAIVATHMALVDSKKTQRMSALIALGFVSKRNGPYEITRRGRRISVLLRAIATSAGYREGG